MTQTQQIWCILPDGRLVQQPADEEGRAPPDWLESFS